MSRVAVVTGATRSLGLALVQGLAERLSASDVVYLTGRDAGRMAEARASLRGGPAEVRTELVDVASEDSVRRFAELVAERHGGVDIFFSNAHLPVPPDTDPRELLAGPFLETNNFGTTRILRSFGPLVRDGGALLVVASAMGSLRFLAPALHGRFDTLASLDEVDDVVCDWRDAVVDGRRWLIQGWPAFVNIPSKIATVAAVRVLARSRRVSDLERGIQLGAVCPGILDNDAARAWFDMSRAKSPAEAAVPLLDLALGERDAALYGELVREGAILPWSH